MSVVVLDSTYDYIGAAEAVLVQLDDNGVNTFDGHADEAQAILRAYVYLAWQQAIQDYTNPLLNSAAKLSVATAVATQAGYGSESVADVQTFLDAMIEIGQAGGPEISPVIWNAVALQAPGTITVTQQNAANTAAHPNDFVTNLKKVVTGIGDGVKDATKSFLDWLGISPTVLIVVGILFLLLIAVLIANNFKPRRA